MRNIQAGGSDKLPVFLHYLGRTPGASNHPTHRCGVPRPNTKILHVPLSLDAD